MKFKLDKKYVQIGITIFLTAIAILFAYFLFWNNEKIKGSFSVINAALAPILYGLIIAYILTPIMNFFERSLYIPLFERLKWFTPEKDPKRQKHIRAFGLTTTLIVVIFLLYLFFASVIPELIKSIQTLVTQYPKYSQNFIVWLNQLTDKNPELFQLFSDWYSGFSDETDNWLNDDLLPNVGDVVKNVSTSLVGFFKFLWNVVIGLIISVYVLNMKERFAASCVRLCYAVLERKNANKFVESVRFVHHTFIGFLSGKCVDSLIIGMICFIVMTIMQMPYAVLISVVIGVTNIIPFFGPLFGAVPSAIILLMVEPKQALYFVIFIIILQQIDGNFLGPLILSQTTGVTNFWIICSITVFSSLFGVVGMIIAVPVTGVIFALYDGLTNNSLKKKSLPIEPEKYYSIGPISEDGEFTHYEYVKDVKKKEETKLGIGVKKLYLNTKFFFKDRKYRKDENNKGKKKKND